MGCGKKGCGNARPFLPDMNGLPDSGASLAALPAQQERQRGSPTPMALIVAVFFGKRWLSRCRPGLLRSAGLDAPGEPFHSLEVILDVVAVPELLGLAQVLHCFAVLLVLHQELGDSHVGHGLDLFILDGHGAIVI